MDTGAYNRFAYVRNNPLSRVDPTGRVDCNLLGDADDTAGCEAGKKGPSNPTPSPTTLAPLKYLINPWLTF